MRSFYYTLILVLLFSCSQEEAVPVEVDFDIEVFNNDFSIPVSVVIFNNTDGAETYQWTFEGGVPQTSPNRSPGIITYNQKGTFDITLTASNQDGSEDTMTLPIVIDDAIEIDFDLINQVDTFSPAIFQVENNTLGASSFSWVFEGGEPSESNLENPGNVSFTEPGEHLVSLEVGNGRETFNLEKTINVEPFLVADFEYTVEFGDDDLEVPVTINIQNNSISATAFTWSFSGATTSTSTEENPTVVFTEPGIQTIELEATNGKETRTKTETINVQSDTNLRVINEALFGINSSHITGDFGAFFSLDLRRVFTAEELELEIAEGNSPVIDLVYFGLSSTFSTNLFVSPDNLEGTTFPAIENPQSTRFVNSQELCNCSASLTSVEFDAMTNDSLLRSLTIEETVGGSQDFDSSVVPRIVLFETEEGIKGAIQIDEFVENGSNSFIRASLKYQKEPR